MSFTAPTATARRLRRLAERRARRRPTLIALGVAAAVLATSGFTGAMPVSQAEAGSTLAGYSLASYSSTVRTAAAVSVEDPAATAEDVEEVLDAANAAIDAADAVESDVESSDLDVVTDIDDIVTDDLAEAVDALEGTSTSTHEILITTLSENVAELTADVREDVAELRSDLDDAIAKKKAEEEAAEKARLEAEARAQAEREAAAQASSAPVAAAPPAASSGDNSPAGAQAAAYRMLGSYGWGDDQFGCLVALWNKESGWNYRAYNASSGATGIPQALPGSKMASAGADWQTNAATQVRWGLGYIAGRYGSPCNAWGHSQSVGWY